MADEVIYDVNLSPSLQNATVSSILPDIRVVFDSVLTQVRPSDIRDTDMARIYISHPDLNVPITVSPRVWANIDSTTIMDKLEHVLTSKTSLRTDDTFQIHVGTIRVPRGRGKFKIRTVTGLNSCLSKKKSIVVIRNKDNLCLARSIVVAIAHKNKHPEYKSIRDSRLRKQRNMAEDIQRRADMAFDTPSTLNDVSLFEDATNFQIVIFSALRGNKVIYVGQHRRSRIYLYHSQTDEGEHFDTITSITGMSIYYLTIYISKVIPIVQICFFGNPKSLEHTDTHIFYFLFRMPGKVVFLPSLLGGLQF